MKNRDQILTEVESLIGDLAAPLSQSEIAFGWTLESQNATLKLLNEIRAALVERRPIEKLSIGRGLDHWGVEGGQLLENACKLSNHLREMNPQANL